ncbi:hypothetical protein HQ560_22690, partial [bacterium]|nr:hypothetical protein [bacterium]
MHSTARTALDGSGRFLLLSPWDGRPSVHALAAPLERVAVSSFRRNHVAKRTPLYDQHVALGARIVDFHGWELPVQYEGILAEHTHCRAAASLFDTSHMGQLHIHAPPDALGRVTTQNAATLGVG